MPQVRPRAIFRLLEKAKKKAISRSQSNFQSCSHAYLFCVLPNGFPSKRETPPSLASSQSLTVGYKKMSNLLVCNVLSFTPNSPYLPHMVCRYTQEYIYAELHSCCCFVVSFSFHALHPLPYLMQLANVALFDYLFRLFVLKKTSPASQTERLYTTGKSV